MSSFENFTKKYERRHETSYLKAPKGFYQKLIDLMGKDNDILDVGSGNMEYTKMFAHTNNVTAIDLIDQEKRPYIDFKKANAENFKLDKDFDIILLNNLIEHVLDQKKVMINCDRHLRPGGRIILITPNPNYILRRFDFLLGKPLQEYNDQHLHLLSVSETKRLCGDSMLKVEKMIPVLSFGVSFLGDFLGRLWPSLFASNIIYVVKSI